MALAIQNLYSFTRFQILIVVLLCYWCPFQKIFPCAKKFSIVTYILFLLDSKYRVLCWCVSSIRNYFYLGWEVLPICILLHESIQFDEHHLRMMSSFSHVYFWGFFFVGWGVYRLFVLFCFCQKSGIEKCVDLCMVSIQFSSSTYLFLFQCCVFFFFWGGVWVTSLKMIFYVFMFHMLSLFPVFPSPILAPPASMRMLPLPPTILLR